MGENKRQTKLQIETKEKQNNNKRADNASDPERRNNNKRADKASEQDWRKINKCKLAETACQNGESYLLIIFFFLLLRDILSRSPFSDVEITKGIDDHQNVADGDA